MKTGDEWMERLPGGALVRQGLADLEAGRATAAAYLASIAGPRLRRAGLIGDTCRLPEEPELALRREGGDAYSRYNSLLRELVSFEQALDRRRAE